MEFSIDITGIDEAIRLFNEIKDVISSNELKEYLAEKSIEEINKIAKQRLQNSENYIANNNYEILQDGVLIYNDIQSEDGTYISLIIEYGSGIHKEGEPFNHTNTYAATSGLYWLVPVESSSSLANTNYNIINIKGVEYYIVFGQYPKHIYTDAGKIIEKNIATWISEYIDKEMK